jgi:WD40 repeat protein
VATGQLERTINCPAEAYAYLPGNGSHLIYCLPHESKGPLWFSCQLPAGIPVELGRAGTPAAFDTMRLPAMHPRGDRICFFRSKELYVQDLAALQGDTALFLGKHDDAIICAAYDNSGQRLFSCDEGGEIRIWDLTELPARLLRTYRVSVRQDGPVIAGRFHPSGNNFVTTLNDEVARVWDLDMNPLVRPQLYSGQSHWVHFGAFLPHHDWLVTTANGRNFSVWPLDSGRFPLVMEGQGIGSNSFAISPTGDRIVSSDASGEVWVLSPPRVQDWENRMIFTAPAVDAFNAPAVSIGSKGEYVFVNGSRGDRFWMIPITGGQPRQLSCQSSGFYAEQIKTSPEGKWAATVIHTHAAGLLYIWNLQTADPLIHLESDGQYASAFKFLDDDQLIFASSSQIEKFDLSKGTRKVVASRPAGRLLEFLSGGSECLLWVEDSLYSLDFLLDQRKLIAQIPGQRNLQSWALNRDQSLLALGFWGPELYVVPLTGGEPHLLGGCEGPTIMDLEFDPRGRYLAANTGNAIWFLPMPRGDSWLYLPRDTFLERLRSFTNVRVLPDDQTPTGYSISREEFPGWDHSPDW